MDHEADDLARGEVVPGGLIRQLVEAPDKVLEQQSHLDVINFIHMKIYLAEFGDDQIKDVRLAHLFDFSRELEVLEDTANIFGKSVNVRDQVLVDIVWITLELLKVKQRMVVKLLTRSLVQELVKCLPLIFVFVADVISENFFLVTL